MLLVDKATYTIVPGRDDDELAIIGLIRARGSLSRTDLAALTGYSRAKMTTLVGRLVEQGVLSEVGSGDSQGGRRPRMLDFNAAQGCVVGIDLGATSLEVALANLAGVIIARQGEAAEVADGPVVVLGRIIAITEALLVQQGCAAAHVYAIGLGVPGPVEFATGLLIAPPLMPGWDAQPIRAMLQASFPQAQVLIDNDVNMMALGELRAGAGRDVENFLCLKIGTGIGAGIVCQGQIYRGSDGCAGDVGHICVDRNGPVCRCGNIGCLEALAAGPAIAARGLALADSGKSPWLARQYAAQHTLRAEDIGLAAAAGEHAAMEIIQDSGRLIGEALASIVNFFNPRLILLGGGVSLIGHQLLSSVRQTVLQRSLPLSNRNLRIEYVGLGRDAGLRGALALALEHVFVAHHAPLALP